MGNLFFVLILSVYVAFLLVKFVEWTFSGRRRNRQGHRGVNIVLPDPPNPMQDDGIPQPLQIESGNLPTPQTGSTASSVGIVPVAIGRNARYSETLPAGASIGERRCAEICGTMLPEYRVLYHYRDPAISNPDTGAALELDIYYPDLRFAVEYNGEQHYADSRYFNSLAAPQMARDHIKAVITRRLGILLVVIPHTYDDNQTKTVIRDCIASVLRGHT